MPEQIASGGSAAFALDSNDTFSVTGSCRVMVNPSRSGVTSVDTTQSGTASYGPYVGGASVRLSATGAVDFTVTRPTFERNVTIDQDTNTLSPSAQEAVALAAGRTGPWLDFGVLGDSKMAANTNPTRATAVTYGLDYVAKGSAPWLSLLSGGALRFNINAAWGFSGQTTRGLAQQIGVAGTDLAGIKASGVKLVVLDIGTNDLTIGIPEAETVSNIKDICADLLTAVPRVIVRTISPRSFGFTSAQKEQARRINQQIKAWSHPLIAISDCTGLWTSYANANGDPVGGTPSNDLSAYTIDGLHQGTLGAYYMAVADLAAYKAKWGNLPVMVAPGIDPLDVYSATNTGGNRLANGAFTSASGGTLAGGATGTAAGSWTLNRTAGDNTVAGSVGSVVLPTGETVPCQTITIGATGTTATTAKLQQTISNRPPVGSRVRVSAYVKVSGVSKLANCYLRGADMGGRDVKFLMRGIGSDSSGVYYPPTFEGLAVFEFTVASVAVDNQFDVTVQADVGTSGGTVQIAVCDYRVVA